VTWLFTLLAMTVIAVVAGVVTGKIGGGGMDAPAPSLPFRGLPPQDVVPADLETLRFSPALRGYRMDEVDQVLDRLGAELHRRDEEIASLRERLTDHPDAPGDPGEPFDRLSAERGVSPDRKDPRDASDPEPADAEPGARPSPGRG